MILDELEAMGLENEPALQRMGRAESLALAWESSETPSDMIWILFRITLDAVHRTLVSIATLTATGTTVERERFALAAVKRACQIYEDPPDDSLPMLIKIHTAILNDGLAKEVIKLLGKDDEEQRILFDETGHAHVVAWQTLRACLRLTVEDEPKLTAEIARKGFEIVDAGPFAKSICEYLRKGLPFAEILTAWLAWQSFGNGQSGQA